MPGQMDWTTVAARLQAARSYWLATSRDEGSPHLAPVWGAVVQDVLYLYSERKTLKARNIAAEPQVALHLDDAEDVLIVYGRLHDLGRPQQQPAVLAALDAKYASPDDAVYLPSADEAFDVVWALNPSSAMAWRLDAYETSQARWRPFAAPAC